MNTATLLAVTSAVSLACIRPTLSAITLIATSIASQADCPQQEIIGHPQPRSLAGQCSGINDGALQAVQAGERWHLSKNVRDALEQLLVRQNRPLRPQTMAVPLKTKPAAGNDYQEGCRPR
jgi:hypothetical protein